MKQLVSTGIVLSLIASNIIIGQSYISDSKEFQTEIKNKNEIIKRKQKEIKVNQQDFNKKLQENDVKIHVLTDELNKVKNDLTQVQQENESLTKQLKDLESRKEADASQRKLNMQATAYVSTCNGCSGLTYTEYNVRNTVYYQGYHIIAADFNKLPLYSIVRIDTDSESFEAIVLDTGSAIRGSNTIDLLVNTYDDAMRFGRKNVSVTVLREGNS